MTTPAAGSGRGDGGLGRLAPPQPSAPAGAAPTPGADILRADSAGPPAIWRAIQRDGEHASEHAYELVFRTYYVELCQFALRHIGHEQAAEDVVQDVLGTIWIRRHELEIRTTMRSYLYGAVYRRAMTCLTRQRQEARWVPAEYLDAEHLHANQRTPEDDYIARERAEAVESAVQLMPHRRRTVFLLRTRAHLSYAQIAEVIHRSIRNVEVLLRRATHSIRAIVS